MSDALYHSICLRDMPPETAEDQERCMSIGSKHRCWRDRLPHREVYARAEPAAGRTNGAPR